jgi:hypothetical protein
MVAMDVEANIDNSHPNLMSTEDFHKADKWYDKVNKYLAVKITAAVGTMWCAYIFAAIDSLALPQAVHEGLFGIVQWIASFFLQLVLLSVIMVKQNLDSTASDARALQTYEDTELIKSIQAAHTQKLDTVITYLSDIITPLGSKNIV